MPIQKPFLAPLLLTVFFFFSGFLVLLTPLPFAYYLLAHKGRRVPVFVFGATLLVLPVYVMAARFYESLMPIEVIAMGLSFLASYLFIGMQVCRVLKQPAQFSRHILIAVVGVFAFWLLLWFAHAGGELTAHVDAIRGQIGRFIDQFIVMLEKSDLGVEEILYFKSRRDFWERMILYLMPFWLLSFTSVLVLFDVIFARRSFTPIFPELPSFKLTAFRPPFALIWSVVATLLVLIGNRRLWDNPFLDFVIFNALAVLGFVYFLQGLAVYVDFVDRRNLPGVLRFFFHATAFFLVLQGAWTFFLVLGFAENWLDIRKLQEAKT